jgi:LPXTG-motif cell wall-anchored protein
VKDYAEKTGVTPGNAEIEYTADGNAVITLTDAEGNVLDIYNIDPFTGVGTESNGGEVNLPQTGYSVIYNYIMLAAAAMMIFGIYAMAKSRKRDEE